MKTKLYGLFDPRTGELRYVGKTIKTLEQRHREHLRKKNTSHRSSWVMSLKKLGVRPSIELLDEVEGDGSSEEIAMIGIARSLGARLVNTTAGGEGMLGHKHSDETKAKISAAKKGHVSHSPEVRAQISAALKGRKKSAGAIAKRSEKRRGRTLSAEHRAKISDSWKRRPPVSAETRAKMSAAQPRAQEKFRATLATKKLFKMSLDQIAEMLG